MIHLGVRTEYSFGKAYAHIKDIAELPQEHSAIGIADDNSTFGHVQLYKLCKKRNVKPILGVRLQVISENIPKQKQWGPVYIFIATTSGALVEIYELVKTAYDNFYYHPFVEQKDIANLSQEVIVISEMFHNPERVDYLGISQLTPKFMIDEYGYMPRVAVAANHYIAPDDRKIYQLFAGKNREDSVRPQFILNEEQHLAMFGDEEAIHNTQIIANACDVEMVPSDMVKYKGSTNIEYLCKIGAKKKGINLDDPIYRARYEREIELIKEKNYMDYFLIVADMIRFAKKSMLVGPSRGSSAGSLVCYLMDITEVDPIKYGLLFERFIDINREDLPDIDIDFPDFKREKVIKHLETIYGSDHVAHIATVARLKPKSAIGIFSQNLNVPIHESEEVKGAIIERSSADARAAMCILDTFETTEIGQHFVSEYPSMRLVEKIENHASHTGTHAAGIIVCNDKLTKYGGVNTRDNVVMLDKNEADGLNLLKIDCLGLRTLSILEEVADRIGMSYREYYKLPLDDEEVFKIFNDMRLFGIFQFEGYSLQAATMEMGVHSFDDICAITSLARPGPIRSGGTNMFTQRKNGREEIEYLSDNPVVIEATEETLGIIIYQEQLMQIARNYGRMSWEDVSQLRKAASKSLGEEFFNRYKNKFLAGTREQGIDDMEAESVWKNMMTFGSWGFNKSHAVSYAMVSYWAAWAKAYHPVEFAAANMNHTRSTDSAIKILRDLVKHEGIEYVAIDPDESIDRWDIAIGDDGKKKLVGSLTNIPGIARKKAKDIMNRRASGNLTKNQIKKLMNPNTPFDILFPAEHYWGEIYSDPKKFGLDRKIDFCEDIKDEGEYLFIGRLMNKNLRDLNEYQLVVRRGGKMMEKDTLFLNLVLEDDTDALICSIGRYRFEQIGRNIAEHGVVGEDWYLVKGTIDSHWRRIDIKEILNLGEWRSEG